MNKTEEIKSLLNKAIALLCENDNEKKVNDVSLNIISVFRPVDRIEEYVKEIGTLPRIDNLPDYWQMAKDLCKRDGGHLATPEELAQLADYLYNAEGTSPEGDTDDFGGGDIDLEKCKALGLPEPCFDVWSSEERDSYYAYLRGFSASNSYYGGNYRNDSGYWVLCLGD